MKPMYVEEVYALVALMGLLLSEASSHEKAYKELIALIDDGHALTLEKVQHVLLKYSRTCSRTWHPASRVFAAHTRNDDELCNHSCPRCYDTRGRTPLPSRASSRAGSPRPRRTFSDSKITAQEKKIRVSTKSTASLPPFSTATTWYPSKFSLSLAATVFGHDGGARTFNIASNGGFIVVAVVRFRGSPGYYERIIDFGNGPFDNNILVAREDTTCNLHFSLREGGTEVCVVGPSYHTNICNSVIVQDQWIAIVAFAALFTGASDFVSHAKVTVDSNSSSMIH